MCSLKLYSPDTLLDFWPSGVVFWGQHFSWMANKPPIMICPGEVAAKKSTGFWQGWEVAKIITKQVISTISSAMFLSHLLTSCEFWGITELTECQQHHSDFTCKHHIKYWIVSRARNTQCSHTWWQSKQFFTNKNIADFLTLRCWCVMAVTPGEASRIRNTAPHCDSIFTQLTCQGLWVMLAFLLK